MKTFKIILTMFACAITLSACVRTVGDVNQAYQLDPEGKEGIAALTVSCNLGGGETSLNIIERANNNVEVQRNAQKYRTSFFCNPPSQGLKSSDLRLMKLPVGTYAIRGWGQTKSMGTVTEYRYSTSFRTITFKVQPQQVSYIGHLYLGQSPDSARYGTALKNDFKRDLEEIQDNLPNIPKSKIKLGNIRVAKRPVIRD